MTVRWILTLVLVTAASFIAAIAWFVRESLREFDELVIPIEEEAW